MITGDRERHRVTRSLISLRCHRAWESRRRSAQVLWDDLNFEREFYMLPRDTYVTIPAAAKRPTMSRLRPGGAWCRRRLLRQRFSRGQHRPRSRSLQRAHATDGLRQGIPSPPPIQRLYAHTIADEIHQQQRELEASREPSWRLSSDRNRDSWSTPSRSARSRRSTWHDYDGANSAAYYGEPPAESDARWSPDARDRLYIVPARLPDVFVAFIYQGCCRTRPREWARTTSPVYSPDGTRIAFMSGREGNPDLCDERRRLELRRVTNHPAAMGRRRGRPKRDRVLVQIRPARRRSTSWAPTALNLRRITMNESWADPPTWSPGLQRDRVCSAGGPSVTTSRSTTSRQANPADHVWRGLRTSPAYSPNGTASGVHVDTNRARRCSPSAATDAAQAGHRMAETIQMPAWSN